MKVTVSVIIFLISVIFCDALFCQEISTDRPDQTESPDIVLRNHLQIETGFFYEKDNSNARAKTENYNLPEVLLRYGLLNRLELRFSAFYSREDILTPNGRIRNTGFQPFEIGSKILFYEGSKFIPKISALTEFALPKTGIDEYRLKHISPSFMMLMSNEISDKFELGYNIGYDWNLDDKTTTGVYTISLAYSPYEKISTYLESYGFMQNGTSADFRMDYGITYAFRDNMQFDISSGIGLSDISPDFFIDVGFSLRLPD